MVYSKEVHCVTDVTDGEISRRMFIEQMDITLDVQAANLRNLLGLIVSGQNKSYHYRGI